VVVAGCDFRLNRLRFLRQSQFSEELRAVAASLAQRNFEPNCSRLVISPKVILVGPGIPYDSDDRRGLKPGI
jgi:hypothetical protein